MIYYMGEESIPTSNNNSSSNNIPNINVNLNILSTIENIGTIVGVGIGISQIVKVVPPQTKPAVAVTLGGFAALTAVSKELIHSVNKSDLTSISRPASPIKEYGIFDSFGDLSLDLQLLLCVLGFLLIVIYLLIGLIISFTIKNFMEIKIVKWVGNNSFIYKWLKGSNNITMIVIMCMMLYGLISSIVLIYYIFKLKGVV
uniref:hypothetical protein n=1 Tax=Conidiobolus mycophagus TaxID=1368622 RepID=UPI001D126976|nr:hypothetical protein LKZ63_mgp16 [Conidiobolus mycophagus]QZZ81344.1 hypothetical protein [Conidiobolus mycophagus]